MQIIPPQAWGKAHFGVLAYAAIGATDGTKRLNPTALRRDGARYPTQLADGAAVANHSDLDCLRDIAAAGVLAFAYPHVRFTAEGAKLGAWLVSWWDVESNIPRRSVLTWDWALAESEARLRVEPPPAPGSGRPKPPPKLEVDNYEVQAAAAETLDLSVRAALAAFGAHAKTCAEGCVLLDDHVGAACPEGAELAARALAFI